MKLIYSNRVIINIPSVIIQVKPKKLSLIINNIDNKIIKNELKIVIKPIENISDIKLNSFHFDDYIYKYHIIKKDNILEIHKIPECLLNYYSKTCNSIAFINNI